MILFLLLFSLKAMAVDEPVMLFVNLNYSSDELRAAQRVANERHQTLYVLPPPSQFALPEREATPLRVKMEVLIKQVAPKDTGDNWETALWEAGPHGSDALGYLAKVSGTPAQQRQLAAVMDQYKTIYNRIIETEAKSGPMRDQIAKLVKALNAQHKRVDTFIVSGHSDGSVMEGETSIKLEDGDITALTKSTPRLFSEARHVLLLGCYSNTPMSHERWRGQGYFKNATLIAGYGGRSPLRTSPSSGGYLYSTLHTADQIDERYHLHHLRTSTKDILAALKAASVAPNAALEYCGRYLNNAPTKIRAGCGEQWMVFRAQYEQVEKIYLNHPTQDPPHAVDNTSLRTLYTTMQNLCPISQLPQYLQAYYMASKKDATEHLIRLIFWWKLQARYGSTYEAQINHLAAVLKQNGINRPLPKVDGKLSRVEFTREYEAIQAEIYNKFGKVPRSGHNVRASLNKLGELQRSLDQAYGGLYNLDNRIALGWL